MGVGTGGVGGEGFQVGGDRLARAVEVLEGDAQVEAGGDVAGAGGEGAAVVRGGARGGAVLVQEPAEVQVRVRVLGVERQRLAVGLLGRGRRRRLQLAGQLVPVVGLEVLAVARLGVGALGKGAAAAASGATSKSSTRWPDSASQASPPARTTIEPPSAAMRTVASERPRGSCSWRRASARRTRRGATPEASSPCAARRTTRSWNENR